MEKDPLAKPFTRLIHPNSCLICLVVSNLSSLVNFVQNQSPFTLLHVSLVRICFNLVLLSVLSLVSLKFVQITPESQFCVYLYSFMLF